MRTTSENAPDQQPFDASLPVAEADWKRCVQTLRVLIRDGRPDPYVGGPVVRTYRRLRRWQWKRRRMLLLARARQASQSQPGADAAGQASSTPQPQALPENRSGSRPPRPGSIPVRGIRPSRPFAPTEDAYRLHGASASSLPGPGDSILVRLLRRFRSPLQPEREPPIEDDHWRSDAGTILDIPPPGWSFPHSASPAAFFAYPPTSEKPSIPRGGALRECRWWNLVTLLHAAASEPEQIPAERREQLEKRLRSLPALQLHRAPRDAPSQPRIVPPAAKPEVSVPQSVPLAPEDWFVCRRVLDLVAERPECARDADELLHLTRTMYRQARGMAPQPPAHVRPIESFTPWEWQGAEVALHAVKRDPLGVPDLALLKTLVAKTLKGLRKTRRRRDARAGGTSS